MKNDRQVKYFAHSKRYSAVIKTKNHTGRKEIEKSLARSRQSFKWKDNTQGYSNCSLSEYATKTRDSVCWRSNAANFYCGDGT